MLGAWAGTVAVTGAQGVGVHVGQDKWDKAKALLTTLLVSCRLDRPYTANPWNPPGVSLFICNSHTPPSHHF
jgi:hypothetical protein